MEDLQGGFRETFAFEIKVISGNMQRSYLARVSEPDECDAWIESIKSCLKKRQDKRLEINGCFSRTQQFVSEAYDSNPARYVVMLAIFCDFTASVIRCEYMPQAGTAMEYAIGALNEALFFFFALELAVNLLANWRGPRGAPFARRPADWFQLLTVLLHSALFFKPILADFKVVRILRLFYVAAPFPAFASFNVILKALRRGGNPSLCHANLCIYLARP